MPAKYCFTFADRSQSGSNSAYGALLRSEINKQFENNALKLSEPCNLVGCSNNLDILPDERLDISP